MDPWSMRLGGTNSDRVNSITFDRSGNIIVAGSVTDGADLDGSRTLDNFTESIGPYNFQGNDIFISKFDPSGAHQWSKRLGGTVTDEALQVASDSENNIVAVGQITIDADLNGDGDTTDPWEAPAGVHGEYDIFISKFDSSGTHLWAIRLGGTGGDAARGVTVDHEDSIIVTGFMDDAADLNGDGDTTDPGETQEDIHGEKDIFISKFNSSGDPQWAKRLGGSYTDRGCSIAHDNENNIIVTGHINRNVDLNGDYVSSSLVTGERSETFQESDDIFIAKFDSLSGELAWARRLGGGLIDNAYHVSVDRYDDIVLIGRVYGSTDLNASGVIDTGLPEDPSDSCYGGSDIVIAKFDSQGNHLWARRLGGSENDEGHGLAVDGSGAVFVTGMVTGNADLNGNGSSDDGGAEDEGVYGGGDVFIAKFSRHGDPLWSKRLGSSSYLPFEDLEDMGLGITVNGSGDLIIGGYVNGESDLNGDGDFDDEYETITSGVHGDDDAFFTVFPNNYLLFLP